MAKKQEKESKFASKYPLQEVCIASVPLLMNSEFLVDRLEVLSPRDYLSLTVEAHWKAENAIVTVTFEVTKGQNEDLNTRLEDESSRDDLDSGIGEAFEAALRQVYPKRQWGFPVGGVNWKTIVRAGKK